MVDANREGATRDRLLAAAMRLFAERGYGRTTMGDIEEAAAGEEIIIAKAGKPRARLVPIEEKKNDIAVQ